ncbi:MAG TPA: hypothetical protein VHY91_13625 [Pirellulales bacterium]|jgi:hypothetical protein|nr:hypothetical protein [Pirellulales bacterium]
MSEEKTISEQFREAFTMRGLDDEQISALLIAIAGSACFDWADDADDYIAQLGGAEVFEWFLDYKMDLPQIDDNDTRRAVAEDNGWDEVFAASQWIDENIESLDEIEFDSNLIPELQPLDESGVMTEEQLKHLAQFKNGLKAVNVEFAPGVDPAKYGGDPKAYLIDQFRRRLSDEAGNNFSVLRISESEANDD